MKKDGTLYLVLLQVEESLGLKSLDEKERKRLQERWEIIRWAKPIAFSDMYLRPTWCNQVGFGMKFSKILKAYELTSVIDTLKDDNNLIQ